MLPGTAARDGGTSWRCGRLMFCPGRLLLEWTWRWQGERRGVRRVFQDTGGYNPLANSDLFFPLSRPSASLCRKVREKRVGSRHSKSVLHCQTGAATSFFGLVEQEMRPAPEG